MELFKCLTIQSCGNQGLILSYYNNMNPWPKQAFRCPKEEFEGPNRSIEGSNRGPGANRHSLRPGANTVCRGSGCRCCDFAGLLLVCVCCCCSYCCWQLPPRGGLERLPPWRSAVPPVAGRAGERETRKEEEVGQAAAAAAR